MNIILLTWCRNNDNSFNIKPALQEFKKFKLRSLT